MLKSRYSAFLSLTWAPESRRDQEEGGELDSHKEVSAEEIKSREVVLGLRDGLLLLQLFPNSRATDIVFVTLFCVAVGAAIAWCGGYCAMPGGHCLKILLFWWRSTAALVFRVGTCCEVLLFCSPFSHTSLSLIGLLVSADVKQQSLSLSLVNPRIKYSALSSHARKCLNHILTHTNTA